MRGSALRRSAVIAVIAITSVVTACASPTGTPSPSTGPAASGATASNGASGDAGLDALIAAAEAEGTLSTIGLAPDRCNADQLIATFTSRYGIEVEQRTPGATPAERFAALEAARTDPAGGPDVVELDAPLATKARTDGLLQPYRASTWADIPDAVKDSDGYWAGSSYDVLAFESNAATVKDPPQDWSDLLTAARRGQVALPGDPRVDPAAARVVYAAGLSQPGGSLDDAAPGLAFFRKLRDAGTLVAKVATPATVDSGKTPITIRSSSLALAHRRAAPPTGEVDVTIPTHGRLADERAAAISAFAQHPNAAKLWLEFLLSDDGQNILLDGDCLPIRLEAMQQSNAIPTELLAEIPDSSGAVFPSGPQVTKAIDTIEHRWDSVVGLDIP